MKLICAGLPKTGTKSIAQALRILGYNVYDFAEQFLYYMEEYCDLYDHGKVPDFYAMFKDVDAVIDVPSSVFFEELMEAFPDAKVLLSVRDEDAWYQSFKNQSRKFKNMYLTKIKCLLPTYHKILHVISHSRMASIGSDNFKSSYICRKGFRRHNDRVKSVVPAEKLLVYSVDQGWQPLCDFIGEKKPDQPFPHLNVKGQILKTFFNESELGVKINQEVNMLILCSVVAVALISVLFVFCIGVL